MRERLDVLFPGGKRVDIQTEGLTIATDQSVKNGGEGTAPTPFSLFLASMGACAGVYALNFCQKRDLPTDGLRLSMFWERDSSKPSRAKVRFLLTLPEGFPDKYRQGIVRAMDLCAVKKNIENPPDFITEIVD
jgi:ribosomal protein S12 methylthiotransferase accessory factor